MRTEDDLREAFATLECHAPDADTVLLATRKEIERGRHRTLGARWWPSGPTVAPRRRRGSLAGVAVLAASAVAIGVPVALGTNGTRANAVERDPDGSFRIYIRDFRHPQVIERKLRGFGVRSIVTFLPEGTHCREPRATFMKNGDPRRSTLLRWDSDGNKAEDQYLRLDAKAIKPDETFVFTLWYTEHGETAASTSVGDLATGPVQPCQVASGGPGFTRGTKGVNGVTPGNTAP